MKRCIGSAKPHRTVFRFFERYSDAKEVIHKHLCWKWENTSKSGPKVRPKIVKNWIYNEKVHRIPQTLTEPFFAFFLKILRLLKKWFISAFPEIEEVSQNLGPKLGQKLYKNVYLMKRCIGSAKPHRTVFRFSQDITMLKKRFKAHFLNPENISKSGPKLRPKIIKNWIVNEKVHQISKPSQNRFSLFRKILRC